MDAVEHSLANTAAAVYWLTQPGKPPICEKLTKNAQFDLVIVGGGYLGLWSAYLAKKADPSRQVAILEATECGAAASGRNGGFCEASLTHGLANGVARWPGELPQLLHLGQENLAEIAETIRAEKIDCDFQPVGSLTVATQPHQLAELAGLAKQLQEFKQPHQLLNAAETSSKVNSPTYLGALYDPHCALLDPAKLVWGLKQACLKLGVTIFENTKVVSLSGAHPVQLRTANNKVSANQVILATNAFPALLKRLRPFTVPVYDYALMTEPLTAAQRSEIGWSNREGLSDMNNQFHYYRTTVDGRILWGGYDAIYHFGSKTKPEYEQRQQTFQILASNFFTTFPQLEGLKFSHSWGGLIDTCTRFTAFYGSANQGQVAYALGFTGLGVAATRFAAEVLLAKLAGSPSEITELDLVKSTPIPFPPEPLRWGGITLTKAAMANYDRTGGKPNLASKSWLAMLDKLGLGFDS